MAVASSRLPHERVKHSSIYSYAGHERTKVQALQGSGPAGSKSDIGPAELPDLESSMLLCQLALATRTYCAASSCSAGPCVV